MKLPRALREWFATEEWKGWLTVGAFLLIGLGLVLLAMPHVCNMEQVICT